MHFYLESSEFLLDGYAGKQDEGIRFRSTGESGSSEGREAKERAARQMGVRLAGFRLECMENRGFRFLQAVLMRLIEDGDWGLESARERKIRIFAISMAY